MSANIFLNRNWSSLSVILNSDFQNNVGVPALRSIDMCPKDLDDMKSSAGEWKNPMIKIAMLLA